MTKSEFRAIWFGSAMAVTGFVSGCATDTITFSANQKASLALVTAGDTGAEGQVLGDLPQTIEVEKLESKIVKISGENATTQYWVLRDFVSKDTKVNITLVPPQTAGDGKGGPAAANKAGNTVIRLVMKAYAAMSRGDYKLSMELAKKIEELDPTLAAAHLLAGMAHFREGRKADARVAFEKASTLDPEDLDIKKMIDAAQ